MRGGRKPQHLPPPLTLTLSPQAGRGDGAAIAEASCAFLDIGIEAPP